MVWRIKVCFNCVAFENAENYLLYSGICSIPDSFSNHKRQLVSVSRAVCRKACSNIFTNDCSGFLYNRRTQTCTLSPYTGEKLSATAADCDPRNGLEFYRRIRSSGNTHIHYRKQHLMLNHYYGFRSKFPPLNNLEYVQHHPESKLWEHRFPCPTGIKVLYHIIRY